MDANCIAVLTTIQSPTPCVLELARRLMRESIPLVVIGDQKGPVVFDCPGADFYSLECQRALPFQLACKLPVGHYARKNLGYLLAISRGAECIYETDDDNRPTADWILRPLRTRAADIEQAPWCNVYSLFTDELIWPRGLPLDRIHGRAVVSAEPVVVEAPIQQGLANGSPDVDAVWRLVCQREIMFLRRPSVRLNPGTWCPFNSQSTWWRPAAYPLLYLPGYCTFRMTDIWRSFIAQRCLWELGHGIVFHGAEVHQDRNAHRLMKDFEEEIPGYMQNARLCEHLMNLPLVKGLDAVGGNLRRCYVCLIEHGFLPSAELELVDAWLGDVARSPRPV